MARMICWKSSRMYVLRARVWKRFGQRVSNSAAGARRNALGSVAEHVLRTLAASVLRRVRRGVARRAWPGSPRSGPKSAARAVRSFVRQRALGARMSTDTDHADALQGEAAVGGPSRSRETFKHQLPSFLTRTRRRRSSSKSRPGGPVSERTSARLVLDFWPLLVPPPKTCRDSRSCARGASKAFLRHDQALKPPISRLCCPSSPEFSRFRARSGFAKIWQNWRQHCPTSANIGLEIVPQTWPASPDRDRFRGRTAQFENRHLAPNWLISHPNWLRSHQNCPLLTNICRTHSRIRQLLSNSAEFAPELPNFKIAQILPDFVGFAPELPNIAQAQFSECAQALPKFAQTSPKSRQNELRSPKSGV